MSTTTTQEIHLSHDTHQQQLHWKSVSHDTHQQQLHRKFICHMTHINNNYAGSPYVTWHSSTTMLEVILWHDTCQQ